MGDLTFKFYNHPSISQFFLKFEFIFCCLAVLSNFISKQRFSKQRFKFRFIFTSKHIIDKHNALWRQVTRVFQKIKFDRPRSAAPRAKLSCQTSTARTGGSKLGQVTSDPSEFGEARACIGDAGSANGSATRAEPCAQEGLLNLEPRFQVL